jgi:hypothetical protein
MMPENGICRERYKREKINWRKRNQIELIKIYRQNVIEKNE